MDPQEDMFWELAGGDERLKPYGEFGLIDSLVRTYNYTHDEVFLLSWSEAMTMIGYTRNRNYVQARVNELKSTAKKK